MTGCKYRYEMSDVEIFGNAVRQDLSVLGNNVNVVYTEMREMHATLLAKIAALEDKIEALGQAKTAPVREEVPETAGMFACFSVEDQHFFQQRGSEY
jgi:hypothetical protein